MKKAPIDILYLLFALFCINFQLFSQTQVYDDAVELRRFVNLSNTLGGRSVGSFPQDSTKGQYVKSILLDYADPNEPLLSDAFGDNPYLNSEDALIIFPNSYKSLPVLADGKSISETGAGPIGRGMGVTRLADGLARFLAKRTKEELNMAFFNKFRAQVEENIVLHDVFPETRRQLGVLHEEIYYYDRYLEGLRESFAADFAVLPSNLRYFLRAHPDRFNMRMDKRLILEDVLASGQILLDKQPIYDWFEFMATGSSLQESAERLASEDNRARMIDAAAGFKAAQFFSENLLREAEAGWSFQRNQPSLNVFFNPDSLKLTYISPKEAEQLAKDPILLYLFLGLLYQNGELDNIQFSDGKTLRDGFRNFATLQNLNGLLGPIFTTWAEAAKQLDASAEEQERSLQRSGQTSEPAFYRFAENFLRLSETAIGLSTIIMGQTDSDTTLAKQLLTSVRFLNNLNYNVRQQQYVYAVHNMSGLLDLVLKEQYSPEMRKAVLRYGVFMASLVEAQTSDEIAYAFEMFALPAGSSSLKKQAARSFTINAYPGFTGGWEELTDQRITESQTGRWAISPQASVGVGLNWGMKGKQKVDKKTGLPYEKPGGSFSFYVPLIDVGALWAYRLQDTLSNDLPALKWENIIAPGFFAIYGWQNHKPVSVGLGIQRGPGLRRVTNEMGAEFNSPGFRIMGFVAMDIPFVHVLTKER